MSKSGQQTVLDSIRRHLAVSVPYNGPEPSVVPESPAILSNADPVQLFKLNLESVSGQCLIARDGMDVPRFLTQIIRSIGAQRVAISDAPLVKDLMYLTDLEIEEMEVSPSAQEIFRFDVGITTAQAAIAETGTLVLDNSRERHRFVSLVPPVHIAIIDASRIFQTLGEAFEFLRAGQDISPAVTFITGPSRTADIELTLTIGVHGPQELYVIVNEAS
jgi:L-lactate dehydrogenase complex protein LldG